jgi:hypothetical protein
MKTISPTVLFHNHRAPPSIYNHPRASHAHLLLQDRNPLTSVEGSCFPLTTSLSTCFSVACTCITSSWPCTCNRKFSRWVSPYNIRVYYQSPMILSCQNECRLANIRSKTTLGWLFLSSGSILLCLCRYLEVFCEEQQGQQDTKEAARLDASSHFDDPTEASSWTSSRRRLRLRSCALSLCMRDSRVADARSGARGRRQRLCGHVNSSTHFY